MPGLLLVRPHLSPVPAPEQQRLPSTLTQVRLAWAAAQLRAHQVRRGRIAVQDRQALSMAAPPVVRVVRVVRVVMAHLCNTHAAANRPSRRSPRGTLVPRLSNIVADPRHTVGKGNSRGLMDRARTNNRSAALATQAARVAAGPRRRSKRAVWVVHLRAAAPRCR
jgi:hypothetical protein